MAVGTWGPDREREKALLASLRGRAKVIAREPDLWRPTSEDEKWSVLGDED